jgi:hypothetical protein
MDRWANGRADDWARGENSTWHGDVPRNAALRPGVTGPPRQACTTAHGEARCARSRCDVRERGRRRGVLKQLAVAMFD